MVLHLEKEEEFKDLISKDILLVDFYTEWCGPCKMLGTILEKIDYMKVLKVDADKFPNLATKHGIMSVPTLCFYKNGEMVRREIGYHTEEEIKEIYDELK